MFMVYANNQQSIRGRTRLQKMLFLLQQKYKKCNFQYDFYPHDYGPYSSTLQSDIDDLVIDDYLDEIEFPLSSGRVGYNYSITKRGKSLVKTALNYEKTKEHQFDKIYNTCEEIKQYVNETNLDELLNNIYTKYPAYAKYSIYEF